MRLIVKDLVLLDVDNRGVPATPNHEGSIKPILHLNGRQQPGRGLIKAMRPQVRGTGLPNHHQGWNRLSTFAF